MSDYDEDKNKPFNDAMEHQQKIEGFPGSNKGRLPVPIRLIGYFMFGGIVIMILAGIFGNFFFN